jgi:hypothetical protein
LFRRDQLERDLKEGFRYYLERRIEAQIVRGMPPDEARDTVSR